MISKATENGLGVRGPMPLWADKYLAGELELYAQIATKDGRRFGNGVIIEVIEETYLDVTSVVYVILTDFGNQIALSAEQVERYYFPAEFRMRKDLVHFRTYVMEMYLAYEGEIMRELIRASK